MTAGKVTHVEGPCRTFTEKSDVTLAIDTLVTLHTDGTVKAATAGSVIGWMQGRLYTGQKLVNIRLLAKGGTVRAIQSASIAVGAAVMQDASNPTKVVTYDGNGFFLGYKLSTTAGGANEVIEIADVLKPGEGNLNPQELAVPGSITLAAGTSTNGTAAAASADLAALAAEAEKIGDDVRDQRTKYATLATYVGNLDTALRTAGVITTP